MIALSVLSTIYRDSQRRSWESFQFCRYKEQGARNRGSGRSDADKTTKKKKKRTRARRKDFCFASHGSRLFVFLHVSFPLQPFLCFVSDLCKERKRDRRGADGGNDVEKTRKIPFKRGILPSIFCFARGLVRKDNKSLLSSSFL